MSVRVEYMDEKKNVPTNPGLSPAHLYQGAQPEAWVVTGGS